MSYRRSNCCGQPPTEVRECQNVRRHGRSRIPIIHKHSDLELIQWKHVLTLFPEYFDSTCSGRKKVEVRLNDEKRRVISVGDIIQFECLPDRKRSVEVIVEELYKQATFEDLYRSIPFGDFDCEGWTMKEMIDGTYEIYTPEQESKWGALGIRIKLRVGFGEADHIV